MCGQGTVLDPATNECVVDPSACPEGTVLAAGKCVDEGVVTADVEEASEPNGLAVLGEDSADPAGVITLGAEGESVVAHGKIIPFQDSDDDGQDDPDSDTYLISVDAPALVTVTVDGLHGLSGSFLSISDATPLAQWVRVGLNLTGDTSKRQLYLPTAGTYAIAITDSRSLFTGGAAGALPDAPELEYYATFTTTPIAPTALTVDDGGAESIGVLAPGEVKFFTVPMDVGFGGVLLDTPSDAIDGSVVVTNVSGGTQQFKTFADEDGGPAIATALGFKAGDTTTIAVDHVINTALQDVDYDLLVLTGAATELSKTGGTVNAATDFTGSNVFFYDVAAANEIDGIKIAFETDVVAQILDENGGVFSNMTVDPSGVVAPDTMTDYAGHLRHRTPGRYYWVVSANGPADLDATSTITVKTPAAITKGTPTGAVNVDTVFESNLFSYAPDVATDAWQQFTASSAGGAGEIALAYFDPLTAFGRLDDLVTAGNCSPFCDDTAPRFFTDHAANGSDTRGRILLDDNIANYLIVSTTAAPQGTLNLSFARRAHIDLGSLDAADTDARNAQVLNGATTVQRYLVRTQRDNEVQIVADPTALLDVRIQQVNNNETARGNAVNGGITGVAETGVFYQRGDGWTAWTVTPIVQPATAETFDQDVTILPSFYTVADTATVFADACAGGTVQATSNPDDATTGIISAPAGFDLFGTASAQFRASTNGFLNFATAQTGSFAGHVDMPAVGNPNSVIAPFWTDLDNIQICTKTAGTKLTVQWIGNTFNGGRRVELQVILDGSNDSIEFVYGPNHAQSGAFDGIDEGATIGIENAAGTKSKVIGFNQAVATAGSSKKFTLTP